VIRGRLTSAAVGALLTGTACLLQAVALAQPVAAQGPPPAGGWNQGILLGGHVGLDHQALFEAVVVGGQAHIMLDPWGRVTLLPNAELEFRSGIRDWQANADLAVMPTRGVYVGGGLAYRNTQYEEDVGKETRRGYSIFIGLRTPPAPRRFGVQGEMRWSFVSHVRPRVLSVGANFPLLLIF
jgi:hypothetical protein